MNKIDVLIHDQTSRQLKNFITKPSSGLAIVGERGAGKEYLARHIAGTLLEAETLSNHPYLHFIDALIVESAIGSVRELQKKLSLTVPSKRAVQQVVIIAHFDSFGHEAQNAMLKTLEEPQAGTVFILTIDHPQQVLSTIFSRVQLLSALPVSVSQASESLGADYTEAKIVKAHQMSGGAAGLMSNLMQDETDHPLVFAIAEAKRLLGAPRHVRLATVDQISKSKEILTKDLLDGMLRLLVAANKHQLRSGTKTAIITSQQRVKITLQAIKDLEDGVGQKLVLTRLFFHL